MPDDATRPSSDSRVPRNYKDPYSSVSLSIGHMVCLFCPEFFCPIFFLASLLLPPSVPLL